MNNSKRIVIEELNNIEIKSISGGGLWEDIKSFFGVKDDSAKKDDSIKGGGGDFGGGGASGSW